MWLLRRAPIVQSALVCIGCPNPKHSNLKQYTSNVDGGQLQNYLAKYDSIASFHILSKNSVITEPLRIYVISVHLEKSYAQSNA